ncbi:MAG TPA: DOMON-like domain-containing protein [Syntrophobacteraceae bacterium]|nr:DOMON-like domain-containing protein [Syntrophobacteraceae bacterium]
MKHHAFSLEPFSSAMPLPIRITGSVFRDSDLLTFRSTLSGLPADAVIPEAADRAVRKHHLWEETCFELFLARKGSTPYWEFNLSAAGHWNAYRFSDYRQGMQEEETFGTLPFEVQRTVRSVTVTLEIELDFMHPGDHAIEAGVAAVVRHGGGTMTYWALTHCGPQPDFHRRESFLLTV